MARTWMAGLIAFAIALGVTQEARAYTVVTTTAYGTVYNESESIGGGSYSSDWYVPTGPAVGWVFLQHGFSRNSGKIRNMGLALMSKGLMVLSVNCSVSGGNETLARAMANSIVDAPPSPPVGTRPQWLVVSGHSAGGLFASHMAKRLVERNYANWRGVMLYDPVDASSKLQINLQAAVTAGKKVLAILAKPGSCNSSGNAFNPLKNLTGTTYVGFRITDNSKHTDVEGTNSDFLGKLACGTPQSVNIARVQDFGSTYSQDLATNTTTAAYYPGGTKLDTGSSSLVVMNKAIKIK